MKYSIRYGLTLAALSSVLLPPQTLAAQGGRMDLGAALKPAFEAMAKQMMDIVNRRLVMDPAKFSLPAADSMVTITVTNNYKDSARALIKMHTSPPPPVIPPDTAVANQSKKPKRSLVADDMPSDSGVSYKNLTPWISLTTSEIRLAPGETKTFTVGVRIPTDAPTGEYAAWVAMHVVVPVTNKPPAPDTVTSIASESADGKPPKLTTIHHIPTTAIPGLQIISSAKIVVTK